ncbi:MAG: T9SS type A sorting domain-containing protein, partial [Moheibacter sp.]
NELENKITLYPNPTTGIINLQTQQKVNSVSVYNLMGQKVSFHPLNKENTSIDISNLSSGIYFVEVILNNNKKIKTYKVIKN